MIHEEICTYEVCKLAKEKGFNVQTFDWYDYAGNYHKGFIPHELQECPRYKEYYAPTQSLLQRWLREEKKVEVYVRHFEETNKYPHHFGSIITNDKGDILEIGGKMFDTYEHALEDALKYALENLV